MFIGSCKIGLYMEWVHSLKEKRMIKRSIMEKIKNKFNAAVAEVERMDEHKHLVIGIVCVSNQQNHAEQMIQNVIDYIQGITDAQIEFIETEVL